jgi:hypothetical protein
MRPINAFLAAAAKSSMFRSALAARRWLLLMLATLSVATGVNGGGIMCQMAAQNCTSRVD